MSQIFDGLRRSEAERLGADESALPGATELLRRSERQAASRWESGVLAKQPTAIEIAELEASIVSITPPAVVKTSEAPAVVESLGAEKLTDPFGEFQPLQVSLAPQSRLACLLDSGSPAAEGFRLLGVRLRDLRRTRPLKTVLITSTIPQEGKSMVAANLACTLAQTTQQRVLLLEGDLRRPSLSQMFGLGKNPGLSESLQGERSLAMSIYHLEGPGLWMLPSGSAPGNALELLQSGRLAALMDQLAAWFDWIIVDSPPVLPLADTSIWMRLADGILLVARQGTTAKRQLERGLEALQSKKLIGAVLNSSKHSSDYYSYYSPATASQPTNTPHQVA
jgi:capsular exopolysaccharide synthesis family protein